MTSWTTPRDWTNGELVTDTMMDTHVRDNLLYLKEQADLNRLIYSDAVQHANSGVAETDLSSYILPGGTLSVDGQIVRIVAWGSLGATANNKNVRFKFGATSVNPVAVASSGGLWRAEFVVMRTGAATQKVTAWGNNSVGGQTQGSGSTAAETLSGDILIKSTGQSDAASNDVVQEVFYVELVAKPS